tara:strand:+ start:93 stop:566 length:474 start_codon:yes stop_codon:yes gene_type:complete
MNLILKEIVAIIKEETEKINKKIYGTTFLEIVKEKIIDRQDQIHLKNLQIENSNIHLTENINVFEKDLYLKLSLYETPQFLLKTKLDKNVLFIVLKEVARIDILNQNTKKYVTISLRPFTGITMSKETVCNLNFPKNSLILELASNEEDLDVEKNKD